MGLLTPSWMLVKPKDHSTIWKTDKANCQAFHNAMAHGLRSNEPPHSENMDVLETRLV